MKISIEELRIAAQRTLEYVREKYRQLVNISPAPSLT